MLPTETMELLQSIQPDESLYAKSFRFDYDKKNFVLLDGTLDTIDTVEATKQWITLFLNSEFNAYEIYEGYAFGTSIKKLFGRKMLNNGYEESETERQIKQGFKLCPTIENVTSLSMQKQGKILLLSIDVQLKNGQNIEDFEVEINV